VQDPEDREIKHRPPPVSGLSPAWPPVRCIGPIHRAYGCHRSGAIWTPAEGAGHTARGPPLAHVWGSRRADLSRVHVLGTVDDGPAGGGAVPAPGGHRQRLPGRCGRGL